MMQRNTNVKKIIVAVHGIGDQFKYATIQSVIAQFCAFHHHPSAAPLGGFCEGRGPLSLGPPYPPDPFDDFAFDEVYWAGIPREVVEDGHTLEEAKLWARTIVERLQLRSGAELKKLKEEISVLEKQQKKLLAAGKQDEAASCASSLKVNMHLENACLANSLDESDYSMIKQVLEEMIQTIAVLEWLCYLADRAGLFTFNLRRMLDDYLGDVQIVTEFKAHREMILNEFRRVMEDARELAPKAEIYIVAHSEGTVVSLLGLLEALSAKTPPAWVKQVRGLMTLGSPIDKHLTLWPELWRNFENPNPSEQPAPEPNAQSDSAIQGRSENQDKLIEWYNYYDKGDPVGYKLEEARAWLSLHKWDKAFDFKDENDIGFWRYPLPGKAHVDYWKDEEVFGHFIKNVVLSKSGERPTSKSWARLVSYVVPYIGVGALLFTAVFILYKALQNCLAVNGSNAEDLSKWGFYGDVFGTACLLYGVTVTARVPRLTKIQYLRWIGPLFYAASVGIFLWIVSGSHVETDAPASLLKVWLLERFNIEAPIGATRVALATMLILAVWAISLLRKCQSYGLKPLLGLGFVLVVAIVASQVLKPDGNHGPLWPLALATLGFLCLWSLAALIFDLVFVWHLYIHSSRAMRRIGEIVASPGARARWKDQAIYGKPK